MAKEVFASIDLEELNKQLIEQRSQDQLLYNDTVTRTSIFTLGKDKNVSNEQLSSPDLTFIELLRDGLHNPYLQINWKLRRQDVDSRKSFGF